MTIDLVVENIRIPHEDRFIEANLLVDEEKIVGISKNNPVSNITYDGGNGVVLPGGVDVHVHFRDPDENPAEDFESGSLAAAHGGVTTVADMPNTHPPTTNKERLVEKKEIALKKSYIDFALHGGLGRDTVGNAAELEEAGAVAVKTFMTSRFPAVSASNIRTLRKIMEDMSKTSMPLMIHAEEKGAGEDMEISEPIDFCRKYPPRVESVAVAKVCELGKELGVRTHLVHLSTKASTTILGFYRSMGAKVSGETAPKYISLTNEEVKKKGPYAKTDPPLRSEQDVQAIRNAIQEGIIEIVASDHAPYPIEEKEKGFKKIDMAPSGVPGVETTIPVLFDLFLKDKISLNNLITATSVTPAKFLGIYPQKGSLKIGSDADFVIMDPTKKFKIETDKLLTKTHETPFKGRELSASPKATFSRGKLIVENDEPVAKPGRGKLLTKSDRRSK